MEKADTNPEVAEPKVAWRRRDGWEALSYFLTVFAVCNLLIVSYDTLLKGAADFERAFTWSLIMGLSFAAAGAVFKMKPVFLR
ncbi:hypothetical protein P1X14_17770 [Sphingomonas sp. AOB5]|uniref:hypothetical protein n=1 Tax=Sphingomonas sp. AOB5 TaxID=3034017 RepID=UPI0023F8F7E5|nr:hypothetical protein [Sphingomonas sp. AOB5]MDF7777111.1 hypothetical protein [Sphingomonas sp. AOB5]